MKSPLHHSSLRFTAAALAACAAACAVALPTRPARTYDLTSVKWHVWLHPNSASLDGYVVNTVKPFKAGLKSLFFDCGKMTIGKVTVNGVKTTFRWDKSEMLYVDVPKKFQKVEDLRVLIAYSVKPSAGAYYIPGKRAYPATTPVFYTQGEAQDNHCWLPTYDFPNDKAMTEGWITVPSGWKVLSNGALKGVKHEGLQDEWHWKMNVPISTYLINFTAGPYDVGYEKLGKLSVQYWAPQGLLPWGKAAFGNTGRIIALYEKLTGFKYPFPKFAQAAVPDFMFGGMENASDVTQTISALFPPSAAPLENSSSLVAHELAHQWFGDTVTTKDWANAWLNEGFATFMPWFLVRKENGEGAYDIARYGAYQQALMVAGFQKRPVVYSDYDAPMDNFGGFIYAGGGARLAMLMQKLGEPLFWKGVHSYLEKEKFTPVDTPTFFKDMSAATGVNLDRFMKQWFYTAAVPTVNATVDGSTLKLTQTEPYFDISMPVWILHNGAWVKKSADLASGSGTISLEGLEGDPIVLDPHKSVLANEKPDWTYSDSQWLDVFKHAPTVTQSTMLGGRGFFGFGGGGNSGPSLTQDQWADLAKTIVDPSIQPMLVRKLDASNHDLLMTFVNGTNPFMKQAAINRLGTLYKADSVPADVTAALTDILGKDDNPVLRNDAYSALMRINPTEELAQQGWHTDSFRESMQTTALNWWAETKPDQARAYALQALYTGMKEPVRTTAIRILGRLGDQPGQKAVYNELVKVVQEGSFGAANAAMGALARIGNPDAIAIIEPFTHSDMIYTKRAAQSAVDRLKSDKS